MGNKDIEGEEEFDEEKNEEEKNEEEKKEVVTPNEKPKGNFIPLLITGAFEHKTYEDKPDEYLPYALLSEAFDDSKMKYYVEELEDASIMSASFILLDKGTSEEETNEEETNDIEEAED